MMRNIGVMSINEKSENATNYRRVLLVATVASTIDQFCMNDISILSKEYIVHVAANFEEGNNTSKERIKEFVAELKERKIIIHEVGFSRNPANINNVWAYKSLKNIISNYNFELIHCHTPIAAMLARLAFKKKLRSTKVIYTAHGFHFYTGAPLKNWALYYPIEKWLSRYTDILITINKEDYIRAQKYFKVRNQVIYIPGVGVDVSKYNNTIIDRIAKREEIGVPKDAFLLVSVGELNKNKNHETIIKAIAELNSPNIHYLICGQGVLWGDLHDLVEKLGVGNQVKFLGYRQDVSYICKSSDLFVFPSHREGLSVALMEAMAIGLPVVCSKIRGNVDLIHEGYGGYLISPDDVNGYKDAILKSMGNNYMGSYNQIYIKNYDLNEIRSEMEKIYFDLK
jgi:glycosyltransferase involved in cell wall biosynthesis